MYIYVCIAYIQPIYNLQKKLLPDLTCYSRYKQLFLTSLILDFFLNKRKT